MLAVIACVWFFFCYVRITFGYAITSNCLVLLSWYLHSLGNNSEGLGGSHGHDRSKVKDHASSSRCQGKLWFILLRTTLKRVVRMLSSLDHCKSNGLDGMPSAMLQTGNTVVALPLCSIINTSVFTSSIPSHWKKVLVKCLYEGAHVIH